MAVTSFLFIVYRYDNRYRVRPPPKHLLPLLSRSILDCLYARFDPNCHRYYWPATYRGRKTEKSRNCYRDALFDVEPRKSQAKTRKGKEKRNRLLRSLRLLLLGHRYPWRNFISTPSFPSSFPAPHPLRPSSAIAIDDGFHGREESFANRENHATSNLIISISLSRDLDLSCWPSAPCSIFYSRYIADALHAKNET